MQIELTYSAVKGGYEVSQAPENVTINKVRSLNAIAGRPPHTVVIDFEAPVEKQTVVEKQGITEEEKQAIIDEYLQSIANKAPDPESIPDPGKKKQQKKPKANGGKK